MKRSTLNLSFASLFLLFCPLLTWAQMSPQPDPTAVLPLWPRLTGMGLAGIGGPSNDSEQVGWGDLMLPLAGNRNGIWYVDAQGKTAFESDWLAALGTGMRTVYRDSSILGAYVFVDRDRSPQHNTFWFISPGVETLGEVIDFRANGYIPTNTRLQYGRTDWADNFGVSDFESFQGHSEFDTLLSEYEEVGWGTDAELGARLPGLSGTRVYAGGYYFHSADVKNITGVEGRLEIPFNRTFQITARDSYDNVQHNSFLMGLKINLGGVNNHPRAPYQPIQERLLDPIERNLATLGQGVGEPVQDVLIPVAAPPEVERDNIWYFSPAGSDSFQGNLSDCTINNVCVDTNFNQSTIDGINSLVANSTMINTQILSTSPSFYLAPGNYSSVNNAGPLALTNDWLWGRSADFTSAQQSALLAGALVVNGNNNLLDHIILTSASGLDTGIQLNPGSLLTIQTSTIGSLVSGSNYHTGIALSDASLTLTGGSQIIAYGNDNKPVTGINAVYSTTTPYVINIMTSEVQAQSDWTPTLSAVTQQNVTALSLINAPQVTLSNAQITSLATVHGTLELNGSNLTTGLYASGSQVTIQGNSTIQAQSTVTADNNGSNLASAMGNNSVGQELVFQNNNVTINGSTLAAEALVEGNNNFTNSSAVNAATGIGENLVSSTGTSSVFKNNTFTITASQIQSTANVMGINSTFIDNCYNFATGIGNNSVLAEDAVFINNSIALTASTVSALAVIGQNNLSLNFATGIGGNDFEGNASFNSSTILLTTSTASGEAQIGGESEDNFASGIGGNDLNGNASFNDITLTLSQSSTASGVAEVGTASIFNLGVGIGGKGFTQGVFTSDTSFNHSTITLTTSTASGVAEVNTNDGLNFATGIGGFGEFTNNTNILVSQSLLEATTSLALNVNANIASGLYLFGSAPTVSAIIDNSNVNVTAIGPAGVTNEVSGLTTTGTPTPGVIMNFGKITVSSLAAHVCTMGSGITLNGVDTTAC